MRCIENFEEIIDRIKNYRYVSFDLFDTLIKRDVSSPSDVFRVIEADGNPGFCEQRIAAERFARQHASYDEITLDEIYQSLSYSTKDEEADLEKRLCTANPVLMPVYNYCLQNGITIIITTDIYLSKNIIEDILIKCGYSDYSYLFVSSEEKCMKASGKLYDVVLERLGIAASKLIHIGDNYKSDYTVPRQKGIEAIWVNKEFNRLKYSKKNNNLKHDYWYSFSNNHLQKKNNFYDTGYECYGPLLYGFVKWIIEKIEDKGIEKVYFLSRDGEIVKKVFDKIYDGKCESHYLYVSRRALLIPSLKLYNDVNDFIEAYHFPYRFSAQKFCRMLGCDNCDAIDEVLKETGIDDEIFYRSSVRNNAKLGILYQKVTKKIGDYIDKQYDLMERYLAQERFYGKVAIVDIGWHGNMQKNLMRLIDSYGINADISGYYVAMTPNEELLGRSDMCGYLFDAGHNQAYDAPEQLFNAVFELLFTASHGTVLDYHEDGPSIVSRQGEYEITDEKSLKLIRDYQGGAVQFCNDANEHAVLKTIDQNYAAEVLFSQFLRPDLQDAEGWGQVVHDDVGAKPVVTFRGRRYYLLHPHKIIGDYRECLWRIGFLRQLFVADIPYYKAILGVNKIKKVFGNK